MCRQIIHPIEIPVSRNSKWEQWCLFSADWHWDNPKCMRDLLKRHLDQAKERDALVFVYGDLLCLMQGTYDPRKAKSSIREEHNVNAYLDAVIETCAEWLEPWKENLALITPATTRRTY